MLCMNSIEDVMQMKHEMTQRTKAGAKVRLVMTDEKGSASQPAARVIGSPFVIAVCCEI